MGESERERERERESEKINGSSENKNNLYRESHYNKYRQQPENFELNSELGGVLLAFFI